MSTQTRMSLASDSTAGFPVARPSSSTMASACWINRFFRRRSGANRAARAASHQACLANRARVMAPATSALDAASTGPRDSPVTGEMAFNMRSPLSISGSSPQKLGLQETVHAEGLKACSLQVVLAPPNQGYDISTSEPLIRSGYLTIYPGRGNTPFASRSRVP